VGCRGPGTISLGTQPFRLSCGGGGGASDGSGGELRGPVILGGACRGGARILITSGRGGGVDCGHSGLGKKGDSGERGVVLIAVEG